MLFALVLGLLVGGAAVLLVEQWLRDALAGGERPVRVFTPAGAFIVRGRVHGAFARRGAA